MKKRTAVKGGLHRSSRHKKTEKLPPAPGIIRPETGSLRLPADLDEQTQSSLLPHGVVLVIVVLWLMFIAIITWFVAQMPAKSG